MAKAKKPTEPKSVLEREYIVPLRQGWLKVPKYKRASKAIKTLKEFIARHMKTYDSDLRNIKIDGLLNNEIRFRGMRKPPAKIKVKAVKFEGGIVRVELVDLPEHVKFEKARTERKSAEVKKKVEAILFTTGRFLTSEEISQHCNIAPVEKVKEVLEALSKHYVEKDSALEIVNEGDKWKLNIKKEHLHLTQRLLENAEMNVPIQETLAVVAYKQPSVQSDVVKVRGNKSYEHLSFLLDAGFITSEKFGRTKLLKLTEKFYDYFDVVHEQLSNKLKVVEEKVGEIPKEEISEEEKKT